MDLTDFPFDIDDVTVQFTVRFVCSGLPCRGVCNAFRFAIESVHGLRRVVQNQKRLLTRS